jgi:TPP-dependent pyruvate/acetoin dehydrogenase alpha subunit
MLDSMDGARRRDVSTRVTRTPHDELGLTVDDVLSMFRIALMARLIDEAAFRQNRMGRAPFVVPVSGHEGCQIGTAWAMRRGTDIWLPYYRDLAVVLVAGMTPYEVFLGIFSKADDPSSGGRQMPPLGFTAPRDHHRFVADRDTGPHAAGTPTP